MRYITLLFIAVLSGCTAISDEIAAYQQSKIEVIQRENYRPASEEGNLHNHVERLARQLFDTANMIDVNRPVIVGTFLPANTLKPDSEPMLKSMGLQLQESFVTLTTQAGLSVIEYKSLPGVQVTEEADLMLSRDVQKLNNRVKAQYMLTGTYMQQENSIIVNVKLISVNDKTLVAAATDYLPLNSLYSTSKIQLKDGHLYRGQY